MCLAGNFGACDGEAIFIVLFLFKSRQTHSIPLSSLQSNTFPYLCFGDNTVPQAWGHGEMFSARMASTFMRVSARGLQTSMFPASNVSHHTHTKSSDSKWREFYCETDMGALCKQSSAGSFDLFPTDELVSISQEQSTAYAQSNSYLKLFGDDSACNRSNTGRVLSASKDMYSVSLCDIIDANLDILIKFERTEHGDMTVYWRQDETSVYLLSFLAIISIYLVSCVAQNIVSVVQGSSVASVADAAQEDHWRHRSQYLMTSLVAVVLFVDFVVYDTFDCLVLDSDKRLLVHLFLYVAVEWVWQVSVHMSIHNKLTLNNLPHHEHFASTVSILTSTLLLISVRIHLTFDNPYVAILTALFGVRTCYKLLWLGVHDMHVMQHAMQVLDLYVFCSLLGNGIMPGSASVLDGTLLQLMLVFIAFIVAALLVLYKMTAKTPC